MSRDLHEWNGAEEVEERRIIGALSRSSGETFEGDVNWETGVVPASVEVELEG